ncbi:MAG: hypothetical protein ACO3A2_10065, partial [Bdellovibrionia bacterium]
RKKPLKGIPPRKRLGPLGRGGRQNASELEFGVPFLVQLSEIEFSFFEIQIYGSSTKKHLVLGKICKVQNETFETLKV